MAETELGQTIEWNFTRQAIASQALVQIGLGAESGGWAVLNYGTWADVIIHAMREATHLAWVTQAAMVLGAQGKPMTDPVMLQVLSDPDFLARMPIGSPQYRSLTNPVPPDAPAYATWKSLNLQDAGWLYMAVQACCRKIYRTIRPTRFPPISIWPDLLPPMGAVPGGYCTDGSTYGPGTRLDPSRNPSPEDMGWERNPPQALIDAGRACDLGVAPIVVAGIVVVGVAAIAAGAWLASEISEDNAKVEIETGRATAKGVIALEIAKAQIAKGMPVTLPKELLDWGETETRQTSTWFRTASVVGIVGAAGVSGYAGYKYGSGA